LHPPPPAFPVLGPVSLFFLMARRLCLPNFTFQFEGSDHRFLSSVLKGFYVGGSSFHSLQGNHRLHHFSRLLFSLAVILRGLRLSPGFFTVYVSDTSHNPQPQLRFYDLYCHVSVFLFIPFSIPIPAASARPSLVLCFFFRSRVAFPVSNICHPLSVLANLFPYPT